LGDGKIADDLLQKAMALEPKNPAWPEKLAELYDLETFGADSGQPDANAKKALKYMEKAQAGTTDVMSRFDNLRSLAKLAFKAGEMEKARDYATQLVTAQPSGARGFPYDDAIHTGHTILGRVALREGRLDEAKSRLLASGNVKKSPMLGTSGPNMSLAQELLAKGENATVLEYFKLCGSFWSMGTAKLDRWSKEVNAGLAPEFGANLVY
jgi:hypothetical protein